MKFTTEPMKSHPALTAERLERLMAAQTARLKRLESERKVANVKDSK